MDKEVIHVTIVRDRPQPAKSDKNGYSQCRTFEDIDNIDGVDEMDSYNKMSEETKAFQTDPLLPQMQRLIDGTNNESSQGRFFNVKDDPNRFHEVAISANSLGSGAMNPDSKNHLDPRRNSNYKRVSKKSTSSSFNCANCCFCCKSKKGYDETDSPGRRAGTPKRVTSPSQKFVKNVAKLAFLKILLVDMLISVGDTVTDFLQGFNLIWDFTDGTIRQDTVYYGIAVIFTSWLPSIFCLVHLWFTDKSIEKFLKKEGLLSFIALVLIFIVFFPIMPTLFYLQLLCQTQAKQDERYRRLENRAHEVKSIAGAIEAPLQLIIVLWLMLRGILTMPWNEPLSSTCVEDSLGRIVCFPSIPMASIFFSMMSILKATFDLNISPLIITKDESMPSLKQCSNYFLRFTPFLLANVIFRVSTFAFIFVYLDYWAIFPCAFLLVSNLVYFGMSFTKLKSPIADQMTEEDDVPRPQLQNFSTVDFAGQRGIPRGYTEYSIYNNPKIAFNDASNTYNNSPRRMARSDPTYTNAIKEISNSQKPLQLQMRRQLDGSFDASSHGSYNSLTRNHARMRRPHPSGDTIDTMNEIFGDFPTSLQSSPTPSRPHSVQSFHAYLPDNQVVKAPNGSQPGLPPPKSVSLGNPSLENQLPQVQIRTVPPPSNPTHPTSSNRPPIYRPKQMPPFEPPLETIHSTNSPENSNEPNDILPSLQLEVNPNSLTMLPNSKTESTYIAPSSVIDDPLDDPPIENLMSAKRKTTNFQRFLSTASNKSVTPSYINEENTSIFLNAFSGMFFPSCHTHLPDYITANPHFDRLLKWQRRLFQTQVLYFNTISIIVLIVVFILVSAVESYNYQSNTLNPFWFGMGAVFLVSMMMLSFTLAVEPDIVFMFHQIYDTMEDLCSRICSSRKDVPLDNGVNKALVDIKLENGLNTNQVGQDDLDNAPKANKMKATIDELNLSQDSGLVDMGDTTKDDTFGEPNTNQDNKGDVHDKDKNSLELYNDLNKGNVGFKGSILNHDDTYDDLNLSQDSEIELKRLKYLDESQDTEDELNSTQDSVLDLENLPGRKKSKTRHDDTFSLDSDEYINKRTLFKHSIFCFIATFIVFLPAIIGLIVFKFKQEPNPYIYLIEQNSTRVSFYDMTILTAFPITTFKYNKSDIIVGSIDNDCYFDNIKDYQDKIIVVNQTSPKCSALSQDEDFLKNVYNSSAKAIILLDNTPKYRWRVSSHHTARDLFFDSLPESSDIPILMLRESDWRKFDSYLSEEGRQIYVVFGESRGLDLEDILPCTNSKTVQIGKKETNPTSKSEKKKACSEGKHLYDNGTMSEQVCVSSECWTLGQRCPQSYFENLRQFNVNLKCSQQSLDGTTLDFKPSSSEEILVPAMMEVANGASENYCCKMNGNATATFVEVLGEGCSLEKSRDVVNFMSTCKFTKIIKGGCEKGLVEVAKFCKVPNHNCVIKEYYNTYCASDEPLQHCYMSQVNCL